MVDYRLHFALQAYQLPSDIARQIGPMYLKRYAPNPAVEALKGFKKGLWEGVLVWALSPRGEVLGWALRARPSEKKAVQVMVFVKHRHRRLGIGGALLDVAAHLNPKLPVVYYPHSAEAKAFYDHRARTIPKSKGI